MKYVVWVQLDKDGEYEGEYSGIKWTKRELAEKELEEAKQNPIYHAWIKEV